MNRTFSFATMVLAVTLVGAGAIRLQGQAKQSPDTIMKATSADTKAPVTSQAPAKTDVRSKPRLSADQAYKANCMRCHSELPKLRPRAMTTVLMHMRVRANIPQDEARAILDYLTR